MNLTDYGRFQTQSETLASLLRTGEKVALSSCALFIYGEEGSGRRTLARWIHDHGQTRGRFISWSSFDFDPQSIRDGDVVMIESINELEASDLLKLKRHIEMIISERGVRARLISTSSVTPAEWMDTSALARELGYRLCVIALAMPSLKERSQDLAGLSQMLLRVACMVNGLPEKTFSPEALAVLQSHNWTGNVAELNNVVERAALKSETPLVSERDLSFLFHQTRPTSELLVGQSGITLFEMEKKLIFQTLEITRQNKTRAAQILGISIRTLRNKLNSYREAEAS